MKDLALNRFFSVYPDPNTLDIAVVEGREAFEQAVIISLFQLQEGLLGNTANRSIEQRLRQTVTRVARRYDEIDSIEQLNIERSQTNSEVYKVKIVYDIGESFAEEVVV